MKSKSAVNRKLRQARVALKRPPLIRGRTLLKYPKFPDWLCDFKIQAAIVALIAFFFYANTIGNEYVLDDTMVIVQNDYVYEGVAGLPGIFTSDAYNCHYKRINAENQLSGGRYRPLSIATFALEQQFLGTVPPAKIDSFMGHVFDKGPQHDLLLHNMHVRHVINILLFALSVVVLLYFLRIVVFRNNPIMALLAAIIFTIHPVHSEVVANVKSRDEIMSLLFICLTFIFAFKYQERKNKWLLGAGLLSYFLAFLSKEYAISLIVLLPVAYYLFNRYSVSRSIAATLPYLGVVLVYFVLRIRIVGSLGPDMNTDILNNPYALATNSQILATKIATLLNYLRLLFFPNNLSADYSFNTIAYKNFGNLLVWLSIIVHLALIAACYLLFKIRNVLSFAIAFYLVHLVLISNIFFNIGATMGERLIYHSSVGFSIAMGYLLYKGAEMIKPAVTARISLAGCMLVLIGLCGFRTIERNPDWKNNGTLFLHDIKVVPRSVLVKNIVGALYIDKADSETDSATKKEDIQLAIKLIGEALSMNKDFVQANFNMGVAYYQLKMPDSCIFYLEKVRRVYANYPQLTDAYENIASILIKQANAEHNPIQAKNDLEQAIMCLKRSSAISPARDNIEAKLGNAYHLDMLYDSAEYHNKLALALNPNNIDAITNMASNYFSEKNYTKAISFYKSGIALNPGYVNNYTNIAACYGSEGKSDSVIYYSYIAILKDPAFSVSYEILAATYKMVNQPDSARKYEALVQKRNPGFRL